MKKSLNVSSSQKVEFLFSFNFESLQSSASNSYVF